MKHILLGFLLLVNVASYRDCGESKLDVRANISLQANGGNPVAVDLVLVSDKKLLKELSKMTASEWFQKRNQIQLDYPKETGLSTQRWEWVPGQAVRLDPITVRRGVVGAIVFANYFSPGAHRVVIDKRKSIIVNLGAEDFTITPEK